MEAFRRHEISDLLWEEIHPLLPGEPGKPGRPAKDNRKFVNAVVWVIRTGVPWRDLPPQYGHWAAVHKRYRCWIRMGVWNSIWEVIQKHHQQRVSPKSVMIDASHIKAHSHAAGARGGNQAIGLTKGGRNTKIHSINDQEGFPLGFIITSGEVADCTQANALLDSIEGVEDAEVLLADRGYDSNQIIDHAKKKD